MRLQPDPKTLFLIVGRRNGRRFHFGFVENNKERPLCGARIYSKLDKKPNILHQGRMNCPYCLVRYKKIVRDIKKLGVEWVCYGEWKELDKRTFESVNPDIKIRMSDAPWKHKIISGRLAGEV